MLNNNFSQLLFYFIRHDFNKKYQGSFFGNFWALITPIFLLAVYTLVFGLIFKSRWGFTGSIKEFALIIFSGLIFLNIFTDVLSRSSTCISDNTNLIKKVFFKIEIIPLSIALSAFIQSFFSLIVLLVFYYIILGFSYINFINIIIIFITFIPIVICMAFTVSILGAFFKDIKQIIILINHSLLFITPIFYSIDAAPIFLKKILIFNPLTFIIEQFRLVVFLKEDLFLQGLFTYFIISSIFCFIALKIFLNFKYYFNEFL